MALVSLQGPVLDLIRLLIQTVVRGDKPEAFPNLQRSAASDLWGRALYVSQVCGFLQYVIVRSQQFCPQGGLATGPAQCP